MANIDNLKERILSDDREKAKKIEDEARAKAEEIVSSAKAKAESILEEVKVRADKDGRDRKDRIVARAQLDLRNLVLAAKQEAIDKVIDYAVSKVSNMSDEDYSSFIEKMLLNSVETGEEEVIISEKDKNRVHLSVVTRVNQALISQGKKGGLHISSETRNMPSGFVLKREGLEINCSIESRIRILRDSLEGEIASLLFEGR
jgi:V/A-type H+-transporting ATPase subunit E